MAAEMRPETELPAVRERRAAIWPWLLMPLVVLLVFAALYRMHHPTGTPWAAWTHPGDSGAPPAH